MAAKLATPISAFRARTHTLLLPQAHAHTPQPSSLSGQSKRREKEKQKVAQRKEAAEENLKELNNTELSLENTPYALRKDT